MRISDWSSDVCSSDLRYDGSDAYFQDSNIVWIDNPAGAIGNDFLFALISNVDWSKLNSTTITRIYGPDLRGLSIKYPKDSAEQKRKIGRASGRELVCQCGWISVVAEPFKKNNRKNYTIVIQIMQQASKKSEKLRTI